MGWGWNCGRGCWEEFGFVRESLSVIGNKGMGRSFKARFYSGISSYGTVLPKFTGKSYSY